MRIERKSAGFDTGNHVTLDIKAAGTGTIEGYGSIYGNVDNGWDLVEAGAFADSLASDRRVKMLWQHDPGRPIGVWDEVGEDEKGLRVKGRLLTDTEAGREAHVLVKEGAMDGLSIGYRTLEHRWAEVDGRDVRIIEKAELWEVSLVTFPMNPEATIDAVKAAEMSKTEFGRKLLSHSPFSRRVTDALLRGGYEAVKALSHSGDDHADELLEAIEAASLLEMLK